MKNKTILLAPDSFKGSMTSLEFIECAKASLKDYNLVSIPIADGGEGTINAICEILKENNIPYVEVWVDTFNQYLEEIKASYIIVNNEYAIIESAKVIGLYLSSKKDTMNATSYGLSFLIKDAKSKGIKKIYICLGGSSTTDSGVGMLYGLGLNVKVNDYLNYIPKSKDLTNISYIEDSKLNEFKDIEFYLLNDVTNPLYGKLGAAYIFSPQKGASKDEVKYLDEGLKHFANMSKHLNNIDDAKTPGAGAAGGLAYAFIHYFKAKVISGIDYVLSIASFEEKLQKADAIISGEGCIDEQSFMGKVLSGLIKHAEGKPIIFVCGQSKLSYNKKDNITIYPMSKYAPSVDTMTKPKKYLSIILDEIKKTI